MRVRLRRPQLASFLDSPVRGDVPKQIAVVYLARIAEGMDVFTRFSNSYQKYSSGHDHDLIILAKGLRNRGERAYIEDIFSKIDHRLIRFRRRV